MGYKLVTYRAAEGRRAGVVVDDLVYDAETVTGEPDFRSVLGILQNWRRAEGFLAFALVGSDPKINARPLASVTLEAPVQWPGSVFCAGANYSDHMLEMARVQGIEPEPDPRTIGLSPWHFLKASRAVAGPGEALRLPEYSSKVDWEAELVAVIGYPARNVPAAKALDYVAGYTIANDLSARDHIKRDGVPDGSPFKYDWVSQKCFDQSCPVGPWIVPARDIVDPQALGITLKVNGIVKQDSHTSRMIFSLAEQIAHLSTRLTLHPGDLVLSGTPAGVGIARGEYLNAGDEVEAWVEGIGTLANKMI
jgi:2-keto-4-pentenoate hydratase/2-oxohepta-3-ene-1,7-dioic acid hydratase in catechol pathway